MSGTSNIVALLVTRAGWVGGAPCWEAHALLEPEVERFWRVLGCRCCGVLRGACSARSRCFGCFGVSIGPGPPSLPRSAHRRARSARPDGSAVPALPLRTPCFARVVEFIYGLSLTLIVSILYILAI